MKLTRVAFFVLFLLICDSVWCQEEKSSTVKNDEKVNEKRTSVKITLTGMTLDSDKKKRPKLICPGNDVRRPFFLVSCEVTKECSSQSGNKNMLCCSNRCLKGVPAPLEEPVHSPSLFGLIERVCPSEHLPEILPIKECSSDSECSPRICCPEKMSTGAVVGYCRTAQPILDRIPVIRPFMEPLKLIISYMQCTPPPPPFLDLFPKKCNNSFDCFPNLCCQEKGKRFCRPPKRSLLTLLTTVAQRFVPSDVARDFLTRVAP